MTSTTTAPNADRKSTASITATEHDSTSTASSDAAVTTAAAVDVFKCYKGDKQ